MTWQVWSPTSSTVRFGSQARTGGIPVDGLEARLRSQLSDWPSGALTLYLLAAAAVLVYLALFAPPPVKLGAAVWVTLP